MSRVGKREEKKHKVLAHKDVKDSFNQWDLEANGKENLKKQNEDVVYLGRENGSKLTLRNLLKKKLRNAASRKRNIKRAVINLD